VAKASKQISLREWQQVVGSYLTLISDAGRSEAEPARLHRWFCDGCRGFCAQLPPGGGVMRYKTWRSRNDTHPNILCAEGAEAFESLPVAPPMDRRAGGRHRQAASSLPHTAQRAEARGGPRPHIPASIGGHASPGTAPSQHRLSGAQGERRGPTAWRASPEELLALRWAWVATSADQVAQAQCALA